MIQGAGCTFRLPPPSGLLVRRGLCLQHPQRVLNLPPLLVQVPAARNSGRLSLALLQAALPRAPHGPPCAHPRPRTTTPYPAHLSTTPAKPGSVRKWQE